VQVCRCIDADALRFAEKNIQNASIHATQHMCKTFGKAVMPARIFGKVHVRNSAGNELQAEPGGVAL
jgi:hypothetical protein